MGRPPTSPPPSRVPLEKLRRIRREYGSTSDAVLARRLRLPVAVVRAEAERARLGKCKRTFPGHRRMPRWTEDEVDLLRRLYATTPNVEIARILERTSVSVATKAHHLGLAKAPERLREMGHENRDAGGASGGG